MTVEITILYGEKKLEPIQYSLRETVERRWWCDKTLYWVDSEFGSLGPIEDKNEALLYLAMAQRS